MKKKYISPEVQVVYLWLDKDIVIDDLLHNSKEDIDDSDKVKGEVDFGDETISTCSAGIWDEEW